MTEAFSPVLAPMLELSAMDIDGPFGLRLDTRFRLPRRLDVTFDQALVGEGWHDCESDAGRPFRWMGIAQSATVELAVDRSVDLAAELDVYLLIEPKTANQLTVAIDGSHNLCPHRLNDKALYFTLPRIAEHSGTTIIMLSAPSSVLLPDERLLSVACSKLRIRPLHDGLEEGARVALKMSLSDRLSVPDVIAAGIRPAGPSQSNKE